MDKSTLKSIAESAQAFAEPLDLEKLVADGVLEKKGKSYYIKDIKAMPKAVSDKIKTVTQTKNGVKVTFYKNTKASQKLAKDFEKFL